MASPYTYQSTGGSVGGDLASRSPLSMSGRIWFLHNTSGADAGGTRGLARERPLATLAQAYTNAAAGDVIRCLSGHAETLTAAQTLGKAGLRIESEGEGSSRAQFTCNGAIAMFDITAAGVILDNLFFPASSTAPTARVRIASAATWVKNCYFECGANDTAPALKYVTGAGQAFVKGTTFISTATTASSQPSIGLEVANALSDMWLENVTFNGDTYGWSDFAFKGTAAITRLEALDLNLLNNSDFYVATGSVYRVHPKTTTGASYLELTA